MRGLHNIRQIFSLPFYVHHYPVGYLAALTAIGFTTQLGYATYCVFKNPDLYLSYVDGKHSRGEHYGDKIYNRTFRGYHGEERPLVTIVSDGDLKFFNEKSKAE